MTSLFAKMRAVRRQDRSGGLGTFIGVFTPSMLTILGVILYLRTGWVVGNVGLVGALGIVILANMITLATALSVSSVATNMEVGPGGAYYIISRSLGVEIGGQVHIIGMAVVPTDKIGGTEDPGFVLAGDIHFPVPGGADGEDHGVIDSPKLHQAYVTSDIDVAVEAHLIHQRRFFVLFSDVLGLLVIRGDSAPDEAERCRQPFDKIDAQINDGINKRLRGIKPGRARADD